MADGQGSACGPDFVTPIANWYFLLTFLYNTFVVSKFVLGEGSSVHFLLKFWG